MPSVSGWVRANQSRFMSKPYALRRVSASRPSGFCVGRMTTIDASRICSAAQSWRSASSQSTRSDASVPLSSPPCTLPAIQRIAGFAAAIAAARAGVVSGSISSAAAARTPASPCALTRSGLPDDRVAQRAVLHRARRARPP